MTISAELTAVIEAEAAALTVDKYRKLSSSLDDFLVEFGGNLAQADTDKDKLVGAKFDWSKMEKFRGYFELLTIVHGQRVGLAPASVQKEPDYIAKMEAAKTDRRYLARIAGHIAEVAEDKNAAQTYHTINKGSSDIDTLNDIMAFVPFIRRYPDLAKQICPNCVEITDAYLDEAMARAIDLFKMRGYVVSKGIPENMNVDRQNRFITLCLNAQSEIKKFADSAFCENPAYYDAHYASTIRKAAKPAPAPVAEPAAVK